MQNTFQKIPKIIILSLLTLFIVPTLALAHQPRITESRLTEVPSPEVSKAYYGKLSGEPDVYVINASESFNFYVNVLVPDIAGQKKDVSVMVLKDSKQIAVLDGINFEWKKFYEPFGADTYWMGPEYKVRAEAGTYEIRVSNPGNDSKYSLAIGEIEAFDGKEGLNALTIIPRLKKDFWGESPIGFIVSPFGWGLIVVMYLLAGIVGLILRFAMKKFRVHPSTSSGQENIGKSDRLIRLAIGVGLLLWAMLTTWSPILIFFSGFAIFEAIFSWCGFYAA
ncbi:MAG: DUF2892 domain-containing protein, partial [Candidatus Pacebacteria bacterium]|nr:DUF2892 domain-containing protein [Candidatus Paceibacterota bacterium]